MVSLSERSCQVPGVYSLSLPSPSWIITRCSPSSHGETATRALSYLPNVFARERREIEAVLLQENVLNKSSAIFMMLDTHLQNGSSPTFFFICAIRSFISGISICTISITHNLSLRKIIARLWIWHTTHESRCPRRFLFTYRKGTPGGLVLRATTSFQGQTRNHEAPRSLCVGERKTESRSH